MLFFSEISIPCQSFERQIIVATVLTILWRLTVIRDSLTSFLISGQSLATHHGRALPSELHWHYGFFAIRLLRTR